MPNRSMFPNITNQKTYSVSIQINLIPIIEVVLIIELWGINSKILKKTNILIALL